jgi:hypothetical protein
LNGGTHEGKCSFFKAGIKQNPMKGMNKKVSLVASLVLAAACTISTAQNLNMDFVYGGMEDAEIILQAYLKPYANVLGSDLNAGWYNTARPHRLGGLDVTATVSWAKAPASLQNYDMNQLELNGRLDETYPSLAPTIAGSQEIRPQLSYSQTVELSPGNVSDVEYARYTAPNGTGIDFFPLPMAQLTVGLPLGSDISVRFIPVVGYRDYGSIGLWGVGGRHSLSQWIPLLNQLDFLDLAVQGGYTKVTSTVHVSVEPLATVDIDRYPDTNWNDQFVIQKVDGWTMNLISSQTFSVLTLYQGIGYASSLVQVMLQGHFPVHSVFTDGDNLGLTTYEVLEDPVRMKFKNFNNLRLNLGVRLKFGLFTLHYDFTHTLYATHSVGLGVSFN